MVTARFGHAVQVVDVNDGKVLSTIDVGVEPTGLVEVAPGKFAVALSGEQAVAIVDIDTGRVQDKFATLELDPRAVGLVGQSLYVAHMSTERMSKIDLSTGAVTRVDGGIDNSHRGPAGTLTNRRSMTIDTEGGTVNVPSTFAADVEVAPISDQPTGGDCGGGYGASLCENVIVPPFAPADGPLQTDADTVVVTQPQPGSSDGFTAPSPNVANVLNPGESRFQGIPMNNAAALATFDGGRGRLMLNTGSRNAVLLRSDLTGGHGDVVGVVEVGHGAESLAVTHDGKFAYTWNQFDGSLSEIELPTLSEAPASGTSKFVSTEGGAASVTSTPRFAAQTFVIVEDALDADVRLGRLLFHDALDTRIAANGGVSCATCHPDGRSNGATMKFTFGRRDIPSLAGGILETAPFHWAGDVPNVPALNDMTVLPFMGGSGLDATSFATVAKFIDTIPAMPTRAQVKGLTEQEERGLRIFESDETACTTCHAGDLGTDNRSYAFVNSQDDLQRQGIKGASLMFQTPVLKGLARTGPYMHDGSSSTIDDVVQKWVKTNRMGKGSHLTTEQMQDLVAYLKTL